MTDFPVRGQKSPNYWDLQLKAYIDERLAGTELGFAERLSPFTTTTTAPGTPVTGLSTLVTGQGRPVDVQFYAPNVYHSVANTDVICYLRANGIDLDALGQTGSASSPSTTAGPSLLITRRLVLLDGDDYTFDVCVFGGAAGTCNLVAAGFAAIQLSVVSR